jgi:hypothetical protein
MIRLGSPLAKFAICLTFFSAGAVANAAIRGVHTGAFTADGKRLTTFGTLPDTAAVIVDGRHTTAGALRAQLRKLALGKLGAPKTYIGRAKATRRETSVALQSVFANVAGTTPLGESRGPMVRPDPDYCEKHRPSIVHAKGAITPGGYVVVEGLCLGTGGIIRLAGTFTGGWLDLTAQNWDATSITAAIPAVSGVYDQTVQLEVIAGRQSANMPNLHFTATREILPLPAHFITTVSCSPGNVAGDNAWSSCEGAAGLHFQEDTGTDTWQAQLPKDWVLTSLELSTASGTILGTAGFNDAPPDAETWSVSWQSGIIATTYQDSIVWGIFISTQTVNLTEASYVMTLYASGPAGTMPP